MEVVAKVLKLQNVKQLLEIIFFHKFTQKVRKQYSSYFG